MKEYNMVVEIPADLLLSKLESDVAWEISELDTRWSSFPMPGTLVVGDRKVIHIAIRTSAEDVLTLVESLILSYELAWVVFGITSRKGYPVYEVDPETEEEIIVGYESTVPKKMSSDIYPYLNPRFDSEDVELPKDISWIHKYSGQENWK